MAAIYPKEQTNAWDDGSKIKALRGWTGVAKLAPSPRGRPRGMQTGTLSLYRGFTIGPWCIQAVAARAIMTGQHLLTERPERIRRKWLSVHSAVTSLETDSVYTLNLTNLGHKPFNLPKNYVVALAELGTGPLCVLSPTVAPAENGTIVGEPKEDPAST